MEQWMQTVEHVNQIINSFVWGPVMLGALLCIGLYFTVRTGFLQIRKFPLILKETVGSLFRKKNASRKQDGGITSFQALATALASTIGVGNIVGVATAITMGGPGAVFWMWVSALLGMMTKYAEVVLAVHYRRKNKEGQWVGGPMYYIRDGLKSPFLAGAFAVFGMLASFGIGNMTQANSISSAMQQSFGIHPAITGVVIAVITALVVIGGLSRIAKVTEKVVPFMAVFFIVGASVVIVANAKNLPAAFSAIFRGAFGLDSVAGGITGSVLASAMKMGIARGVFSNEAGLGSAPIVHAAADTDHPARQGLWGAFEVFADTLACCTLTALAILSTDLWKDPSISGAALSSSVFESVLGQWGGAFLSISIFLFAFASIVGWSYYGERCGQYLFGGRFQLVYKVAFVLMTAVGATMELKLVWSISDTLNGLMAIPNLIALVALNGVVIKLTKEAFSPGGVLNPGKLPQKRRNGKCK